VLPVSALESTSTSKAKKACNLVCRIKMRENSIQNRRKLLPEVLLIPASLRRLAFSQESMLLSIFTHNKKKATRVTTSCHAAWKKVQRKSLKKRKTKKTKRK
jgi:hypothetical protein